MGRGKVLRTYGHYRNRCVSTDAGDIFRSSDESKQIFNTSSSESGLGPSDSVDSVEASIFCDRAAKNKALTKFKANEDGKAKKESNKRKREPSKKEGKLFTSDKDSSDCSTPAQKRVPRQALRDTSNNHQDRQTAKRQPAKRNQPKRQHAAKNQSSSAVRSKEQYNAINFSEFDDYSLIISDSPPREGKESRQPTESHIQLGTSTPCDSVRTRATPSPDIQTADISFIPAIFENSDVIEDKRKSFSSCHITWSPPVQYSKSSLSEPSSVKSVCDTDTENDKKTDEENLERLEESFASLWVGERRLRRRKEATKTETDHPEQHEETSSSSNPAAPDEDPIAIETRTLVKQMQENLQKKALACSDIDLSHVSVFDGSRSLFESSGIARKNTAAIKTTADKEVKEEHQSHDFPDCVVELTNLSLIFEDGEEEEEDAEEEEQDAVEETEEDGEEEDEQEECAKSFGVRPDLTHSFAEALTPAKARAQNGDELSPLEKVLEQCGQDKPLPFTSIIPARILRKCVKIGEGVYGEVFRAVHDGESVALKIIPIEGDFEVNDEPQKTFREILPEIVISNELSRLREGEENNTSNFCPVKSASLVQGRYPKELLKQWDIFHEKKNSENDRPDVFGDDQLYIMLEFGDGGCDLDACKLTSAAQAISILQQVACALAVGEQELKFEHRDLHVGNVLVQPTQQEVVTTCLSSQTLSIRTHGIHANIIDFTLSRLTKEGCTVFCDLATDDTLFEGKGDYQFDIYRMMKKENKNNWERFHPYTNVLWLHYLCDKLIHHRHFQETGRPHRESLKHLRQAYSCLLEYTSASHFVLEDCLFDT
ncbi:uncharacterized protein LOC143294262 [Babylonia areolata]|uniref:uncharacterized protein LOC143294262 n=1 Tax=Babylonia areolata TaxID=304850 RepID=UPI003FD4F7C8